MTMSKFVAWNSQDLEIWANKYAVGKIIELEGHQIYYVEKDEGEPVILLNGFNLDWHTWIANIDAFSERNKVHAFDFWSSGFSTRNPLDYGYDLFG